MFSSRRASEVEGTGRVSNSRVAWDGLGGGASSSRGSEEGAGDSDLGSVNTEALEKYNNHQPCH